MSSPIYQSDDLDPALRYAPRWVRERSSTAARSVPPPMRSVQRARPDFSGDLAMVELQRQLMLDPDAIPEPVVDDVRALKPIVFRFCGVMGLAALIAWGIVSFPSVKKAGEILSADVKTPAITDESVNLVLPQMAKAAPLPNLGRADAPPQASGPNEVAEVTMNDPTPPPASDPSRTSIGAVAAVTPLPEAMPLQAAPKTATATPAEAAAPHSDDTEITAMIKRGKDLLMSGDIASARLLLRRAADAGNAEAALALGATFDPLIIRRLGAVGMRPDIEQARQWYQRAADLGSASAMGQLAKLAQSQ